MYISATQLTCKFTAALQDMTIFIYLNLLFNCLKNNYHKDINKFILYLILKCVYIFKFLRGAKTLYTLLNDPIYAQST